MEHIFSSTNRQAQALYWIPSQPFLVSCATSSILLNKIDHKVIYVLTAVVTPNKDSWNQSSFLPYF